MRCEKLYDPILVTGTGRSGTSIVAGLLWRLGIYMGAHFNPAGPSNVFGHFEDQEFNDLMNAQARGEISIENFILRWETLCLQRRALYRPWGVKNPKIADMLDLWYEYYPQAKLIWCRRNRDDTIESIARTYDGHPIAEHAADAFEKRAAALERGVKQFQFLIVEYDDLFSRPDEVVDELLGWIYSERAKIALRSIHTKEEVAEEKRRLALAQNQSPGNGADVGQ